MNQFKENRLGLLIIGAIFGAAVATVWPHEPLHANSTDRDSKFAMTTCSVSRTVEGVFVLDFLTGQLTGGIVNPRGGKFQYLYKRNVAADFGVNPSAEPHYAIVCGGADLQNAGSVALGKCVVYVAELSSGRVHGYSFPYRDNNRGAGVSQLIPLDSFQFREASN